MVHFECDTISRKVMLHKCEDCKRANTGHPCHCRVPVPHEIDKNSAQLLVHFHINDHRPHRATQSTISQYHSFLALFFSNSNSISSPFLFLALAAAISFCSSVASSFLTIRTLSLKTLLYSSEPHFTLLSSAHASVKSLARAPTLFFSFFGCAAARLFSTPVPGVSCVRFPWSVDWVAGVV